MDFVLLTIVALVCGLQVMHAKQLLSSALWLAGASASVAAMLYLLGAPQVAAVELSVGAGLVTVLFVFAISIAGEATFDPTSVVPKPLAWVLTAAAVGLLGWTIFPPMTAQAPVFEAPLAQTLWQGRELDMLMSVVVIFCGVMGVLGLLTETRHPVQTRLERKVSSLQQPPLTTTTSETISPETISPVVERPVLEAPPAVETTTEPDGVRV